MCNTLEEINKVNARNEGFWLQCDKKVNLIKSSYRIYSMPCLVKYTKLNDVLKRSLRGRF